MAPIFLVFVLTHVLMIGYGILSHVPDIVPLAQRLHADYRMGLATLGAGGMLLLFLRAFSMGAGTFTGIEAVSNGLQILREPRVQNGKRTMVYMSISLAVTAGGILVCYLLLERPARAGQNPERRPGRRRFRRLDDRSAAGLDHHLLRGGAAVRGRPDGFRRRAPGHGQHGRRLLVPSPVRLALGQVHDPERRAAHGRRRHAAHPVFPRIDRDARGHVFDQRLSDLHALPARDVPVLDQEPAPRGEMEEEPGRPSRRAGAQPDDPGRSRRSKSSMAAAG